MGCEGSRSDALEPRYLESWTKETESTRLTSTDTDVPLSAIQNIPSENSSQLGFSAEKNNSSVGFAGPAQTFMKVRSTVSEARAHAAAVPASQQQAALSTRPHTAEEERDLYRDGGVTLRRGGART